MRRQFIASHSNDDNGRFNSLEYLSYPWYVQPSISRRWGPKAWVTRLLGRKLPGDDGNRYSPEGYTFLELGPQAFKGKGLKEMENTKIRLAQQDRGGCPFSFT